MDKPQGKPIAELRRIVAADQRRWERLAELWNHLTEAEQLELIETARVMAGPPFEVTDPRD